MLAVVVTFGAHSAIDWTWFVPGTAVPALICAGWLAGRGPATRGVGRVPRRRRLTEAPGIGAAVVAITAVTLLCAWAIWQPLRSQDATAAAITAFGNGDATAAIDDARNGAAEDPVAVAPLLELAAIYTATGDLPAARNELVNAAHRQPENAQTWLALGEFDLQHHHAAQALASLRRAKLLDLGSPQVSQALAQAESANARR
jgi:cytochrome c-type biogenesis protein CcmH/NrfG